MGTERNWREDAACRGMGPAHFFPTEPGSLDPAVIEICSSCPVTTECLEEALTDHGYPIYGIWGGTSHYEREKMARERRETAGEPPPRPESWRPPIAHGTDAGYYAHRRREIPMCDDCREAHARYQADRNADRKAARS